VNAPSYAWWTETRKARVVVSVFVCATILFFVVLGHAHNLAMAFTAYVVPITVCVAFLFHVDAAQDRMRQTKRTTKGAST